MLTGLVSSPLMQACHSVALPFSVQLNVTHVSEMLFAVKFVGAGQIGCVSLTINSPEMVAPVPPPI